MSEPLFGSKPVVDEVACWSLDYRMALFFLIMFCHDTGHHLSYLCNHEIAAIMLRAFDVFEVLLKMGYPKSTSMSRSLI